METPDASKSHDSAELAVPAENPKLGAGSLSSSGARPTDPNDRPSDEEFRRPHSRHGPNNSSGSPPRNRRHLNEDASAAGGYTKYSRDSARAHVPASAELSYDDGPTADDAEDGQIWEAENQRMGYDYEDYGDNGGDYDNDGDGHEYERQRGRRFDDRRDGQRYRDLDRDGGRYARGGRGGHSRSPRRNYSRSRSPPGRGRPTDTIIVEGIPEILTLNELRTSFYASTDLVDFPTAQIRAPGGPRVFIQFQALSDSIKWMEQNFPTVTLEFPGRSDIPNEKLSCLIHYARTRAHDSATVPYNEGHKSHKNHKARYEEAPSRPQLSGDKDASPTPSQILVFYPLLPSVNEDVLAEGAKQLEKEEKSTAPRAEGAPKLKSTAPVGDTTGLGAPKGSIHRVLLIRDTATNVSLNYGFVEFWTLDAAMAAMAKFQKSRTFMIAAAPVAVSTIHLGVFVPDVRELVPQIEKQSFHPLFNPAIRVRYRDLHVYPSIRLVTDEPPAGTVLPKTATDATTTAATDEAKKAAKKRKGDGLQSAPAKRPVVMAGQMAMWQKKHAEIAEPRGADGPVKSSANSIPVTARNAPIKISLGSLSKPGEAKAAGAGAAAPAADVSQSAAAPTVSSFLDRDRLQCLLCMMKYKSLDDCDIHERSRNHKTAMRDVEKAKAATARILTRLRKKAAAEAAGGQYRDRAKERRQAFNQPMKPGGAAPSSSKAQDSSPSGAGTGAAPATAQSQEKGPPVVSGKGSSLLAKMGWTAGTGLGAKGEGRTEIVVTHAYQEGVGLGAEGGDLGDAQALAEKKTAGRYGDYVESVQDRARERYKKL